MNKSRAHIVTFPRSGHHILVGLLDTFCYANNEYCEFYTCSDADGNKIDCPSSGLDWTRKNNLCGAGKRITKTHEFDLSLPFVEERKYLVQLRNPVLSVSSWYELEKSTGGLTQSYEEFIDDKMNFWESFATKWYQYFEKENVLYAPYNSLSSKPKLDEIADFLQLERKPSSSYSPDYFSPKRRTIENALEIFREKETKISDLLTELDLEKVCS
ncbi:sulfotransferase domain-containing protein [Alteromonas sp. ASW11-19]|uniref:Sulfotransferase domain-containing protein n=1 Tax=Alteromonas salexigens TaxID=2982530 RepID=A0ABT2VMA5_9ALTE|nr:sulfotransferase domain-containing protein [Alteromonas salexigens]MCU7554442.1 sulfotransferase domain-containing protein [Alteromonas salexigens]